MPPLPLAIFIGALLSAILSTVNGTLLTASSLLSHNVIVPLFPHLKESQKVLSARFMVILCGIAAYFIATSGKTIFDMVQAASSFGSAGILITTLLGLRFRIGGKYTAYITLITGVAITVIGNYLLESKITFLCSLLFCLSTFLIGGFVENQLKKKKHGARYQKK
jgi:Na+/proline symporter